MPAMPDPDGPLDLVRPLGRSEYPGLSAVEKGWVHAVMRSVHVGLNGRNNLQINFGTRLVQVQLSSEMIAEAMFDAIRWLVGRAAQIAQRGACTDGTVLSGREVRVIPYADLVQLVFFERRDGEPVDIVGIFVSPEQATTVLRRLQDIESQEGSIENACRRRQSRSDL